MAAVLRGEEVAARVSDPSLEVALNALVSERIVYFPIRHHSPACAWHVERIIREWKPQAVLIEGPSSFTALIPLILHPKTRAPFAVYTSFVDTDAGESDPSAGKTAALAGPPRHAAYYPFCDYSPELVALRIGSEIGAALRFIDLDYPEQVRAERKSEDESEAPRVESLLAERHFKRSHYLQSLARRAGCRDHNDLWDHLFETRLAQSAPAEPATPIAKHSVAFIRDVAGWCHFARIDATPEELEADGTAPREAAMAAAIRDQLTKGSERILVVTGGFHTVVLPEIVAAQAVPKAAAKSKKNDSLACLIRYSFDQLDALNGYAAGMVAPFYYDQLWRSANDRSGAPAFSDIAAKVLVELGQLTRRKKLAVAVSPADEIAALEQARRLAAMRGHPGPTREDLLDGIRSCFVKGAMDAEGEVVLGLARHTLGGTSIGEVPPEAGVPPIVADFFAIAQKLRLNIGDSVLRKVSLDLYRKAVHRDSSRFLHSLSFLEVPFGSLTAGPDFVKGIGLERLHEHWDYRWIPQTESQLVEASVYGASVEEAASYRLAHAIAELENTGRGRDASEAVAMLVHACQMGLHRHANRLVKVIAAQVSDDPSFTSLANALNQLVLLWESREPLEAHRLPEIPVLIGAAYERACYLLHSLANTPAEAANEMLHSIVTVRDVLRSSATDGEGLDASLFWQPLAGILNQPNCCPLLVGGAAGLLHSDNRLPEGELLKLLAGALNAATAQSHEQIGFLVGLLRTCRELAWRQPALAKAVHDLLTAWNEEEFIARIPHLRLAFAGLTPKETDQVAEVVAQLHGGERVESLYQFEITESEVLTALRVNAAVKKALADDGLDWDQTSSPG